MEWSMEMEGGGRLTICQDGPRVRIKAAHPADQKGLYKVWLRGEEGGKLLLGTLIPEGEKLELNRTLSLRELEQVGCWPQVWAECRLAFPFTKPEKGTWYCEQRPDQFLRDPLLKKWIQGPMLRRKDGDGFCLAAPFHTGRPMVLAGLFCLARVEKWPSGFYAVWRFDGEGRPIGVGKEQKLDTKSHYD